MPLHERIPREIFEIILHFCVGFSTPVRDLVTLQLVCRTWHDIVAETSFLWGTITTEEGVRPCLKALKMAKDSVLDIIYNTKESKIGANQFFRLTGEKINRWRSSVVDSDRVEDALAMVRTTKPPKLERLDIIWRYRWFSGGLRVVLFGGAPATGLKDIRVVRAQVNLAALRLSGLKSLILEDIPPITKSEIITLLIDSPTLEILHLALSRGAVLPTEPTMGEPSLSLHPPIKLAFLNELKLCDLSLTFLSFLLSTLALSPLRFLKVLSDEVEQPVAQLLGVRMRHLKPTLISLTSEAQAYHVTISPFGHYGITIGGLCIILFSEAIRFVDHFQETFTWLSDHLRVAWTDKPLHLTLEGREPAVPYLEWLTCWANVTRLTLSNFLFFDFDLMAVIPLLGRPTSGPSSIWLLPQLEVFETDLACTESQTLIVDMIRARHTFVPGSDSGLSGALPRRFDEIRLSHHGKKFPMPSPIWEFVSEVVQVARGADVYWNGRKWTESHPISNFS